MAATTAGNGRIHRQLRNLKAAYPEVRPSYKRGLMSWSGWLQPTEMSERYRVVISWDGVSYRPRVRVIAPALRTRGDEPLPHVFSDGSVCLHMPDEWSPDDLISETIIPWASEWLLHYELWLVTGEWTGGGHEPAPKRPAPPAPLRPPPPS